MADAFPAEGSGLERYKAQFDCAEVNATFYRAPRPGTLARWAEAVPEGFRFSTKLARAITHERRLVDAEALLDAALAEVEPLGERLGPLLIQLPPSLAFEPSVAEGFLRALRARTARGAALEPRHASWFTSEAEALLVEHRVAWVAADPARVPEAALPGGWPGLAYWRLHGSPQIYRSSYGPEVLAGLAERLSASVAAGVESWCVFDNTASGAAAADGLALKALLQARRSSEP